MQTGYRDGKLDDFCSLIFLRFDSKAKCFLARLCCVVRIKIIEASVQQKSSLRIRLSLIFSSTFRIYWNIAKSLSRWWVFAGWNPSKHTTSQRHWNVHNVVTTSLQRTTDGKWSHNSSSWVLLRWAKNNRLFSKPTPVFSDVEMKVAGNSIVRF